MRLEAPKYLADIMKKKIEEDGKELEEIASKQTVQQHCARVQGSVIDMQKKIEEDAKELEETSSKLAVQQHSTRVQVSILDIGSSDNAYLRHTLSCAHALMRGEVAVGPKVGGQHPLQRPVHVSQLRGADDTFFVDYQADRDQCVQHRHLYGQGGR